MPLPSREPRVVMGAGCGEDPLPGPVGIGVRIFPRECLGQRDASAAPLQIDTAQPAVPTLLPEVLLAVPQAVQTPAPVVQTQTAPPAETKQTPAVAVPAAVAPVARRRVADAVFGHYARRRVARLDRSPAARSQEQTLLRLVRQAAGTRFGRDHGFASIRTVADYQRRVPFRDYEAFWGEYWRPAFPHLTDCTWPGQLPYLALSSGTTTGATKYIPVSAAMLASNRRAALTGLAWFRAARIIGGDGVPAAVPFGVDGLDHAPSFVPVGVARVGDDILETYRRRA